MRSATGQTRKIAGLSLLASPDLRRKADLDPGHKHRLKLWLVQSSDAISPDTPAGEEDKSSARNWRNVLIVVFATCHALKLIMAILPVPNRPDPLPGLAHAYEGLTGSQQNWDMFVTIPTYHRYDVRLVIKGIDGSERYLGPLLPGFKTYPEPEDVRLYLLFERMTNGALVEGLRQAYLRQVDRLLREEHRIQEGETWYLETITDYTRLIKRVQKDGRLFERQVHKYELQTPPASPIPAAQ